MSGQRNALHFSIKNNLKWETSMMGLSPLPHISHLCWFERQLAFSNSQRPSICYLWINRKIPRVTLWLQRGTVQSSALRLSPARLPVGEWDSLHPRHSGRLVQTWDDWPRAPTRLDNRNIQQVLRLRLHSFVFLTTTFFFHKEETSPWP